MRAVPIILIAPLGGAVLLTLIRRLERAAGQVACVSVGVALAAAVSAWRELGALPAHERSLVVHLYQWAASGDLRIGADLRWDPLAAVMALTVCGVGFLIHVYSIGYMRGDPRYRRYFAYLNLFVFSMLLLVLADNLVVLFAGWELVGLCSYLLIGHAFERPQAATAAKKAFLTTRIGDLGFMVGIFLTFASVGSLRIADLNAAAAGLGGRTATAIALLLFCGAVGKSAQLPLHVWLPDAMEGPTPVSALIHAATMVTAGVYLVVRLNPLFAAGAPALEVVAVVGAVTAVFAAVLATAEEDLKRVLAYSTISQLGYMFLGAGVGAFALAIFHLVTHAFFKALLFLSAGSVMHGMGGETSLERMGGLRRALPWTFAVTVAGWGAITAVLPFSGFFSKDAILGAVLAHHSRALFVTAAAGALLTSFYMSRLVFLAFADGRRWPPGAHPHESPPVMVVPMLGLAAGAVAGGLLNLPPGLPRAGILARFLEPVTGQAPEVVSWAATGAVWAGSAAAAGAAWAVYGAAVVDRARLRALAGPLYTLARNRFFVDEIYAALVAAPARLLAAFLAYVVDLRVVDGVVNGAAAAVAWAASSWRRLQTGFVRNYLVATLAGAALLAAYVAVRFR